MPRYGPPPSADAPPPPLPDDTSGRTPWSWRKKALAVIAGFGMVAAFVFEFLPPTSTSSSQQTSTSVAVTSPTAPPASTGAVTTAGQ